MGEPELKQGFTMSSFIHVQHCQRISTGIWEFFIVPGDHGNGWTDMGQTILSFLPSNAPSPLSILIDRHGMSPAIHSPSPLSIPSRCTMGTNGQTWAVQRFLPKLGLEAQGWTKMFVSHLCRSSVLLGAAGRADRLLHV